MSLTITYSPNAEAVFGDIIREIEATQRAFLEVVARAPLAVALFLGEDPREEVHE